MVENQIMKLRQRTNRSSHELNKSYSNFTISSYQKAIDFLGVNDLPRISFHALFDTYAIFITNCFTNQYCFTSFIIFGKLIYDYYVIRNII